MELAFSIGINISEFWELTPCELSIAVRGYSMRKQKEAEEYQAKFKNERELAIYQAYLISRWVWQKRVNIEEILKDKPRKSKEMTDDQMLAQAKLLNRMFGGEVITDGKK